MSETNVVPITAGTGRRRAAGRRRAPAIPAGIPLADLIPSWKLALQSANKSLNTITMYLRTADRFVAYLAEHGEPADAESVAAEQVRAFLVHEQEKRGLSTAKSAHAYLGVFFSWLIDENERTTVSPVLAKDRPKIPTKARTYVSVEEMRLLIEVCKGSDFTSRRDTAIFYVLFDNGMRVGGLTGLRLDDVDLQGHRLRIRLKGGMEKWVPIGNRTAQAIDRYLRVRARHNLAESPWLWLAARHPTRLGIDGVQGMVKRRGEQAGIKGLHPHRFRGSSAHQLLAAGASPDDVKRILGWLSDSMLRHYTEELGDERARSAHARFSPSDRV
ncbi:tyrosine-type recombinase/integrase [Nonomuraea sp. NPDC049400]|uniref:tyrosine-type recombinase/integrase n=1 Tax=Nonomuraea sp. NPDC049400 TaxID=3364352 RepID=UPI0037B081E7